MGCVQEAKRQPLLDSFNLKGVAERIKSGKCLRSGVVSNATVCLTSTESKLLCHGASVTTVPHNTPSVVFVGSAASSL